MVRWGGGRWDYGQHDFLLYTFLYFQLWKRTGIFQKAESTAGGAPPSCRVVHEPESQTCCSSWGRGPGGRGGSWLRSGHPLRVQGTEAGHTGPNQDHGQHPPSLPSCWAPQAHRRWSSGQRTPESHEGKEPAVPQGTKVTKPLPGPPPDVPCTQQSRVTSELHLWRWALRVPRGADPASLPRRAHGPCF